MFIGSYWYERERERESEGRIISSAKIIVTMIRGIPPTDYYSLSERLRDFAFS